MSRTGPIDSFARRLTTLIRGPARLREDINDEIADHLATRMEEEIAHGGKSVDPAAVEAEAIAAFGDPQKIARELRHIHLGDWIMFQRIMVAALVVIVIGMAATAYFSWSAARQQSTQFAKMNDQLASLVELQQAANRKPDLRPNDIKTPEAKPAPVPAAEPAKSKPEPPWVKFQFVAGSQNKPVPGYKCERQWRDRSDQETVQANEQGVLLMNRAGTARLKGPILDANSRPVPNAVWAQVLDFQHQPGSTQEFQMNVSPQTQYTVKFDLSAISWDPKVARRLRVRFEQCEGKVVQFRPGPSGAVPLHAEREYSTDWYVVSSQDGRANEITGLYPGPVKAYVELLPGPDDILWKGEVLPEEREALQDVPVWSWDAETIVPEQSGTVVIKLAPRAEERITAVLFDGSRSRPLANQTVRLVYPTSDNFMNPPGPPRQPMRVPGGVRPTGPRPLSSSTWQRHMVTEYLVTNSRGEFTALTTGDHRNPPVSAVTNRPYIVMPWHTADGKPADFVWPLFSGLVKSYEIEGQGTLYELDASQIATLRLVFGGADKSRAEGKRFVGPVQIGAPGWLAVPPLPNTWQTINCQAGTVDPLSKTTDLLLMATSNCKVDLSMVIAQTKADAPELESHKFYIRPFERLKLTAGQVTEVPVALDELDKWKLDKTEWHRRDVPTTQTQSAATK